MSLGAEATCVHELEQPGLEAGATCPFELKQPASRSWRNLLLEAGANYLLELDQLFLELEQPVSWSWRDLCLEAGATCPLELGQPATGS